MSLIARITWTIKHVHYMGDTCSSFWYQTRNWYRMECSSVQCKFLVNFKHNLPVKPHNVERVHQRMFLASETKLQHVPSLIVHLSSSVSQLQLTYIICPLQLHSAHKTVTSKSVATADTNNATLNMEVRTYKEFIVIPNLNGSVLASGSNPSTLLAVSACGWDCPTALHCLRLYYALVLLTIINVPQSQCSEFSTIICMSSLLYNTAHYILRTFRKKLQELQQESHAIAKVTARCTL